MIRVVAAARARCRLPPFHIWLPDLPVLLSLLGLLARENNGQYDAIYYRYCSFICGNLLMRLGGAKLGSRLALSERSQALLSGYGNGAAHYSDKRWRFLTHEGEHFAGMARVLGVGFAVFLARRKMPLIVVIIAAAVVTALLQWRVLINVLQNSWT